MRGVVRNDEALERELRKRFLQFSLHSVIEYSGLCVRPHRADQAATPRARGESRATHRKVGVEIDGPECSLATGNFDYHAERQIDLIDRRKRRQRCEVNDVACEARVNDAGLAPRQHMNRLNRRVRKQPFQDRAPDKAGCAGESNRSLDWPFLRLQ